MLQKYNFLDFCPKKLTAYIFNLTLCECFFSNFAPVNFKDSTNKTLRYETIHPLFISRMVLLVVGGTK